MSKASQSYLNLHHERLNSDGYYAEQEELIQKLKDESESRNIQNIYALQAVLALSSIL